MIGSSGKGIPSPPPSSSPPRRCSAGRTYPAASRPGRSLWSFFGGGPALISSPITRPTPERARPGIAGADRVGQVFAGAHLAAVRADGDEFGALPVVFRG